MVISSKSQNKAPAKGKVRIYSKGKKSTKTGTIMPLLRLPVRSYQFPRKIEHRESASIQWVEMTPLDFVHRLATTTEEREALSSTVGNKTTRPIFCIPNKDGTPTDDSSNKKKNDRSLEKVHKEKLTPWLLRNWTNPYPDAYELDMLSQECRSTPKAVAHWMGNQRNRYWRKSLSKAMAMGRPASFLLEDSKNIFLNKKLQVIDSPLPRQKKNEITENDSTRFRGAFQS